MMNEFDIPIFNKTYELYKDLYTCIKTFPKVDRYALGQKCELLLAEVLECLLTASAVTKQAKLPYLERASTKLNVLRIYLRMAKDLHILDSKKYVALQAAIDEVGRMLGGWKKSVQPGA